MSPQNRASTGSVRTASWIALGGIAGLLLTEAAFQVRDGSAFPNLNLYAADARFGLRLTPESTQRLAQANGRTTTLTVNSLGFRGEEWPKAPTSVTPGGAILVIGDGAAFGIGVEQNETAAALLAHKTRRTVLNAGVPTYGPQEYLGLTEELLRTQRPSTVVVFLNEADDWTQRNQPNRDRIEVRDGWAIAKPAPPDTLPAFPGRTWLLQRSHAFHALWKRSGSTAADRVNPEVAATRAQLVRLLEDPPAARGISEHQIAATIATAAHKRVQADDEFTSMMHALFRDVDAKALLEMQAARDQNQPGDLIRAKDGRGNASLRVTEAALQAGTKRRNEMEARLATWVETHRDDARALSLQHALADANRARDQLIALGTRVAESAPPRSPLADFVQAMQAACTKAGADLVVVAVPMDARGATSETAAARGVLTDLVTAANDAGARALDATDALNALGAAAFTEGSRELAAPGHAALAQAVASVLAEPPPQTQPAAGLPEGRSRVPTADEWVLAPAISVGGASRDHCAARQLREWVAVDCDAPSGAAPWAQLESGSLETRFSESRGSTDRVTIVTPLLPGRNLDAHLHWDAAPTAEDTRDLPWQAGRDATLTVRWSGSEPTITLADSPAVSRRASPPRTEDSGSRDPLPVCTAGQVNAGSAGQCFTSCAVEPCTEGACTDWMGSPVCL
jgi:hypothetical protein